MWIPSSPRALPLHMHWPGCRVITFPRQHLTKSPVQSPGPFSLQLKDEAAIREGSGRSGSPQCSLRLAGTQKLASSQTGLCVTVARLSEIFFQAINYYIWTSHPRSREPFASCSENQSSFTTFTLAQLQLFIYLAQLFKDAVAFFLQYRYIPA